MLLTAINLAEDPESLAAAHANLGAVFERGGRKEEVGGHVHPLLCSSVGVYGVHSVDAFPISSGA